MASNRIERLRTDIPPTAISIDPEAFDFAIATQGVPFVHYQATRCPVGVVDLDDNQRPHPDHEGCSNGFLYTEAGEITALLTGAGKDERLQDVGLIDGSSLNATFQRYYNCDTDQQIPFHPVPFDRFYLADQSIVVPYWQLTKWHETGTMRLDFPVERVELLIDSQGIRYDEEQDFVIRKGQIVWVPDGKRPTVDLDDGVSICSVRYLYRPYYYLSRLLHEIRVAQVDDPITGNRNTIRMPQAAILNREFLFQNEAKDAAARNPRSPRQVTSPSDGGFGPR